MVGPFDPWASLGLKPSGRHHGAHGPHVREHNTPEKPRKACSNYLFARPWFLTASVYDISICDQKPGGVSKKKSETGLPRFIRRIPFSEIHPRCHTKKVWLGRADLDIFRDPWGPGRLDGWGPPRGNGLKFCETHPLDPTFEADPIGRRLECLPKKGRNINFNIIFKCIFTGALAAPGVN